MITAKVYLIPSVLHEDEKSQQALPAYIKNAVAECSVLFVENERTARRGLKKLWKEIKIDEYQWHTIHKAEEEVRSIFLDCIKANAVIGILSEAGCPGIADPGQVLIKTAQENGVTVIPLVGPNSIILALMASGMNGQCFKFEGYLPIDTIARRKKIKELESESAIKKSTHIFIETPYRNNTLIQEVCMACKPGTLFCIAVDITSTAESIKTKTIQQWKKQPAPDIHKRPAIFLLQAE